MMEAKIRKPAVAGSFYADDAKELRQDVRDCFSQCKNPVMEHVQAVIVPHAGYVFSGVTAASAFAAINPEAEYEHIFLWDQAIMFIWARLLLMKVLLPTPHLWEK